MSNLDIIRAWKDKKYRDSLSVEQLADLPENPAGIVEISNEQAENVVGGFGYQTTAITCTQKTFIHCYQTTAITCTQVTFGCPKTYKLEN